MPFAPLAEPGPQLSDADVRRYARHLSLAAVGVEGQRRLRAARVLVVGAGGLGSPALLYLAAAGVGTLGVVDDDTVDETNLQRQVLHATAECGRPKVESAARALLRTNPGVTVVRHRERVDAGNARELVRGYDVVLDGTDNFTSRYVISDACVLERRPHVWASISGFDGQASVFWAAHGPCLRCVFPQAPPPGSVPSCAEGGVLGALCGVLGSTQAAEAVKLLLGIGEPLVGRLLVHDALAATTSTIAVRKDPACPSCAAASTLPDDHAVAPESPPGAAAGAHRAPEHPAGEAAGADRAGRAPAPAAAEPRRPDVVSARELKRRLDDGDDLVLVDVREPYEQQIARIDGAVLVPHRQILDGSALPSLPRDRPIVLFCRAGVRSAWALDALRAAGFPDVRHLGGGILEWIDEVDPTQPRY